MEHVRAGVGVGGPAASAEGESNHGVLESRSKVRHRAAERTEVRDCLAASAEGEGDYDIVKKGWAGGREDHGVVRTREPTWCQATGCPVAPAEE